MKDTVASYRVKVRAIAEFRYKPNAEVADRRGHLINTIFPRFEKSFPFWRLDGGGVTLADNLERPAKDIDVSTRRIGVTVEDPDTIQQFEDTVAKALEAVYEVIGDLIPLIDRVGVRMIEVLRHRSHNTFDEVRDSLAKIVLAPGFDVGVTPLDWHTKIVHKSGFLQIGPVRPGEDWLEQSFTKTPEMVSEPGIGIDIDSYATGLSISSAAQMIGAFSSVFEITKAMELRTARAIGLVDE